MVMSNATLVERQRWFRFFPDGSIEFLVITRVLMVLLLVALIVFLSRQIERSATLIALLGMLWLDHVLVLWWAVQMVGDLALVAEKFGPAAGAGGASPNPITGSWSGQQRTRLTVRACLPGTFAVLSLGLLVGAPLLSVFLRMQLSRSALGIACLGAGAAFIVLLPFAQRAVQQIRLGAPRWTFFSLIPLLHMLAVHRLARGIEGQVRRLDQQRPPADPVIQEESSRLPSAIAEVTWFLAVVPWAIVAVVMLTRGEWPRGWAGTLPTCCGLLATTLLVVADTAALEHVHRRYVALIRRK